MRMIKLTEANMVRALELGKKHGFMLISAFRNAGPDASEEEVVLQQRTNLEKTVQLKKDLRNNGFSYIPTFGGYREEGKDFADEESFFVLNYNVNSEAPSKFDMFFDFAIEMCDKYNQDAVLVYEPGVGPAYYDKKGTLEVEFKEDAVFQDYTKQYFTRFSKNGKNDRRFSLVGLNESLSGRHSAYAQGQFLLEIGDFTKEEYSNGFSI